MKTMLMFLIVICMLTMSGCQPKPAQNTEEPKPAPTDAPAAVESTSTTAPTGSADLVLLNGTIYTVDDARSTVSAMAVKGSEIVFVGPDAEAEAYIGGTTEVIDLEGKLVLPGFIDSHNHADSGAGEVYSVTLNGLNDIELYKTAIKDFLGAHPEATALQGGGWINPVFPTTGPTKQILDELVPAIPAVLYSEDYHSVWVNSKTLELAGITSATTTPEGGVIERDPDGNPTGTLRENAVGLVEEVIPPYTPEQLKVGFEYFQDMAHGFGITAVHLPGLPGGSDDALNVLHAMDADNQLTMRIVAALRVDPEAEVSVVEEMTQRREAEAGGLFEIQTAKFFMDGVVEGSTAYIEEPYLHMPDSRGELLWDPERYNQMCAALDKAGFQIHVHSIGDASTRITLDGLAYAEQQNGKRDSRHGITHLQMVNVEDIARFAELGVTAVPQPYWFVIDSYYDQAVEYLGQERADQQYPMKAFFDSGVLVASSSDYPVTIPPRPLDAIEVGVTRAWMGETDPTLVLVPTERVTVQDMIASFTINGAKAYFMEDTIGSLEPGKEADFVILDKNILLLPSNEIHTAEILSTYFMGKVVFQNELIGE